MRVELLAGNSRWARWGIKWRAVVKLICAIPSYNYKCCAVRVTYDRKSILGKVITCADIGQYLKVCWRKFVGSPGTSRMLWWWKHAIRIREGRYPGHYHYYTRSIRSFNQLALTRSSLCSFNASNVRCKLWYRWFVTALCISTLFLYSLSIGVSWNFVSKPLNFFRSRRIITSCSHLISSRACQYVLSILEQCMPWPAITPAVQTTRKGCRIALWSSSQ
jgi:hypothetical protein